jgi:hypothetical protein
MKKKTVHTTMSTGLPGLDAVLNGVRPGDNIVLQVDSVDDYIPFVHPFCREAVREGRPLIYFRFADHPSLMPDDVEVEVHQLNPEEGFETFIGDIFDVIEEQGIGACYVFDTLSELTVDWYSDRMLANFFMLTCPYLYDFETATFFALLRDHHMTLAINAIHATAQVVMDIYRNREHLYVQPLKVYKRYSPTMYMLHAWEGDRLMPVSRSALISEILASVPQPWLDFAVQPFDVWTQTFSQARQCLDERRRGKGSQRREKVVVERLLRMAITRDARLYRLACEYFDLEDLVEVGKRMIGTGLIGGKSVGMLLARAIVNRDAPELTERLEAHDSFFIGSDIFYSYLIQNGCWWSRRRLKNRTTTLDSSDEVRHRMLTGTFPEEIQEQFMEMLEYFGQSPIIVRSSSLLEDAYGNAFSGKYESVFCTNQGTPQQRLESFMDAVRSVYASTMRREALAYREHWGLLDRDEQMALLVQRVSGDRYGNMYFPQLAGVGFSFNPYVWTTDIDPRQGMLRLVFGLGTRAVDRSDDDYTRVVSLGAPSKRPEATFDEVKQFAQRRVDVLDLNEDGHHSRYFEEIARAAGSQLPLEVFASRDEELQRRAREHRVKNVFPYVLTFDQLLASTGFVEGMRKILRVLEDAYEHPVDIEFTTNFLDDGDFRINLVQCRPFQVRGDAKKVKPPASMPVESVVFRSGGPVIGNSRADVIDRLIYVVPQAYSTLSVQERYSVARLIGRLTHLEDESGRHGKMIVLLGPGRWGTSSPSLGVPVSFADINGVSVLCEIAKMHEGLVPDVSLGTHFFNDIVEMDMLYLAIYPDRETHVLNESILQTMPNRLRDLIPEATHWEHVVHVFESGTGSSDGKLQLSASPVEQLGMCFLG